MNQRKVMGKTGNWWRNLLSRKKGHHKEKEQSERTKAVYSTALKEKRRWSFRSSSSSTVSRKGAAAAVKIQSVFRGYLARKALNALKGVVKLQALVRGHLSRKQTTSTLRFIQARARSQSQFNHRKSTQVIKELVHSKQGTYDLCLEENIKIVEMDLGHYINLAPTKSRNSYSNRTSHASKTEITVMSSTPRARSDYAESIQIDYPNYMSNTESSRAKVRSHSVPKQRLSETYERQLSNKRRTSLEISHAPRGVRMQRSSSQFVKQDDSTMSPMDSDCGSTSTIDINRIDF